jgi:hypothetical protein
MYKDMEKYFKLSPELAQKIVGYLAKQPLQEVYDLFNQIQSMKLVDESQKNSNKGNKKRN